VNCEQFLYKSDFQTILIPINSYKIYFYTSNIWCEICRKSCRYPPQVPPRAIGYFGIFACLLLVQGTYIII